MIKRILVPLDGSQLAESVVPFARYLATGLPAMLTLLHVIDPDRLTVPESDWISADGIEGRSESGALTYLKRKADQLRSEGCTAEALLRYGKPADVIAGYGDGSSSTLIAMTAFGRAGLRQGGVGSVANRVLQSARCSVLLFHPYRPQQAANDAGALSEVIVPLDGSQLGENAIPIARHLASGLGSGVTLVQAVLAGSPLYLGEATYVHLEAPLDGPEPATWSYLHSVARRLERDGVAAHGQLLSGDAGKAIVDYATRWAGALIVMATRGSADSERPRSGSVADYVVRSCPHPVLIVRPSLEAQHTREAAP